jgi:protoporphyrinogen/coproporphyrinogen III oxidase
VETDSVTDPAARRCAVIGGGISGLAAAVHLVGKRYPVTVFEAGDRAGGVIRTVRRDGFLVDLGPNTLVARDHVLPELVNRLNLSSEVVRAPRSAAIRYVVRNGHTVPLPMGLVAFARTPLISSRAKLRVLAEPFIPRKSGQAQEESISEFVRRRLGAEVLDYAVDPFVSGVYAGDPEHLTIQHALPLLAQLEDEHGSLFWGAIQRMVRARRQSAGRIDRTPFAFREGMRTLPDALVELLGDDVRCRHAVTDVVAVAGGFEVTAATPDGPITENFAAVILALPPAALGRLEIVPEGTGNLLMEIPVPPVATLALGFPRQAVQHSLRGFGLLVPKKEPFRLLGTLFSSSLFPGRAPEGQVLLTSFLGGRRRPEDALLSEDEQVSLALADLRQLLGITGDPSFVERHVWRHAIPQYELGYGRVKESIHALEATHPGLAVAGSIRRGVSVGDALASGMDASDRILRHAGHISG